MNGILDVALNLSGLYRFYAKRLEKEVVKGDRPNHIAIVLDGNRRWAKRNLVMQKHGHFKGADAVENLLDWCEEFDIKIITLYVLSAENLERKNEELEYIYDLIKTRLEKLYNDPRIHKNKMRVKAIGRIELLPDSIKDVISRLDGATKGYDNHFLNIAIAYGGQNELVDAVKKILERPEVQEKLAAVGGMFLFSNKAEEYPLVDGTLEMMYSLFLVEDAAELTGGVVEEAKANLGSQGSTSAGQPIVNLTMNSDGARKWSIVTGSNVGRQVALVLDKKVHMAPNIREKISGGSTLIEGFADINEAKDIAIVLRAGALPAPVDIIEERVIGPSLGADSVRSGTLSIIIGLGLVLVFMLIYYRFSGLIADFALIWNIVLVLAVLASLQATLTLPGIAGLILTVGMSIDANVIIFERIREELRKGKTPKAAVSSGYDRALTTIIDANMTTAIAALVLWQFGTGPIKGFATVLFWGILISMFTAIFVTRTIFNSFTSRKGFTKLSI
jgi:preprotein translocase subunit SecD